MPERRIAVWARRRNGAMSALVTALATGGGSAAATDELCEPAGSYAWAEQIGTSGNDLGRDLAVDSQSNVLLTGFTTGAMPGQINTGGWDAFLTKYNAAGEMLWVTQFGASHDDRGIGVAVDTSAGANGAIYVSGTTFGTFPGQQHSGGGSDGFLAKFKPNGQSIWIKQFGAGNSDQCYRVVVDPSPDGNGAVYVSGSTLGTFPGEQNFGDRDAFIARFTADGDMLWVRQIGSPGGDSGPALGVDGDGNAYIAGYATGPLPGQLFAGGVDTFLAKYAPDGTQLWVRQFGTSGATIPTMLDVDANANIYIAGHTFGTLPGNVSSGGRDAYLAKYGSDGSRLWVRQFGASNDDRAHGVGVDPAGGCRVLVSGFTIGTFPGQVSAGMTDMFLTAFDAGGNQLWIKQFGTAADDLERCLVVDRISPENDPNRAWMFDPDGEFIGIGEMSELDEAAVIDALDDVDELEEVIADGDLSELELLIIPDEENDPAVGDPCASNAEFVAYITGRTWGAFPGHTSAGGQDTFLVKWSVCNTPSELQIIGDLTGDGAVNVFDLLALLALWGDCDDPDDCDADLDGNGKVDIFDLLELLANWT